MPMRIVPGTVVARDMRHRRWWLFREPVEQHAAHADEEVVPALRAVEEGVRRGGLWAAGFLAYEAAPGLEPCLEARPDDGFPRLWFGLYRSPEPLDGEDLAVDPGGPEMDWRPSLGAGGYGRAIAEIRDRIRAGDTYQVNFSYRLRASFRDDPWCLFRRLVRAQPTEQAAFVDTGRWCVCSASPELFLERRGREVISRPMKGTAARGLWPEDDLARRENLRRSEKDRAENVMIVDMVRNDLGRVADVGSVWVERLWEPERFPTVWQLTSTVRAETGAGLVDLLRAAFPAASITGAPKSSTMRIIRELEGDPRRVYTGSVGFVRPGGDLQLNVAIRTVLVDRDSEQAEYGVGGGVVWDSSTEGEADECRAKARMLMRAPPDFRLVESMLWTPGRGAAWLRDHLERMEGSALYFGFAIDRAGVAARVEEAASRLPPAPHKLRVELDRDGTARVCASEVPRTPPSYTVCLAARPVRSEDPFLYHKTTHREVYERALAERPAGCDDVLLWNERGELTESCIANLVVELDGAWITPPVSSGLLGGIGRRRLLREGRAVERPVDRDVLRRCSAIHLVNAVRGTWRVRLGG